MTNKFERAESWLNWAVDSAAIKVPDIQKETILEALRLAQRCDFEHLHQHSKLATGSYDYQCGFLDCLKLVKEQAIPPSEE